jgi:hypothetical protein
MSSLDNGNFDFPDISENYFFDNALICESGHLITHSKKQSPIDIVDFCEKCSSKVLDKCQKCNTEIKGQKYKSGYPHNTYAASFSIPSFCYKCGNQFPWTENKINAAMEIAKQYTNDENEIETIRKDLNNIVKDNSFAEISIRKLKSFMPKIANGAGELFKKLVIEISSETIKKMVV